ncbi:MAG TPA: hypothetical protein VHJ58_15670, partial [Vicinamibacterales bacterium]|nr:hypothetical protein [Vicinamibacterales bacterium]
MTIFHDGDLIPMPCLDCGAEKLFVLNEEPALANVTPVTRRYRARCDGCSRQFATDEQTAVLEPLKGIHEVAPIGDCVVEKRRDRQYDIWKITPTGTEHVRNGVPASDLQTAFKIAGEQTGRRVWYRNYIDKPGYLE